MGGVQEKLLAHCDWFFTHAIAFRYGMIYLPCPLSAHRIHQKNLSRSDILLIEPYRYLISLINSPDFKDIQSRFYCYTVLKEKIRLLPFLLEESPFYLKMLRIKLFVFLNEAQKKIRSKLQI